MMRGRGLITIVLVLSLIATALTRQWADSLRTSATTSGGQAITTGTTQSLSSMPSYALALMLGGLRGPLVMILWSSSESQKADKDLEDFDTKVEWIRLLQPEFDTVHIFQIWNKAYNISVQMASQANKYAAILDALDYAHRTDAERPNNINIAIAIADVYFNKLGGSTEKEYYRTRIREDSKFRIISGAKQGEIGWRRTRMDPILDVQGNLLTAPLLPGQLAPSKEYQYIQKYQPFPYGTSPITLSFNYYKKAQLLQKDGGQHHLQMAPSVIDSRPALALRTWAEEEWERARRLELASMKIPEPPTDVDHRLDLEMPTAAMPVNTEFKDQSVLPEALFEYQRAADIAADAIAEYKRHLSEEDYKVNIVTYQSHLDHMIGMEAILRADHAYLQAMTVPPAQRKPLLDEATRQYQDSMRFFAINVLKYYIDDAMVKQLNINRSAVSMLTEAQLMDAVNKIHAAVQGGTTGPDQNREDRHEYDLYLARAAARLQQIAAAQPAAK